jgi:dGTPase
MDEDLKKNMNKKNENLSEYACKDEEACRFYEIDDDIRSAFWRDVHRIIYSLSYTRYMDKTQVFSFNENDNITKRMTHVQMVSGIARTIGRALNLNEDLIEAAALGHDLGHVPFGHTGEMILNDISLKYGEGYFNHNVQSARLLMYLENNGKGSNITLQVLDAIMCHNGELELQEYRPIKKTKEEFLNEYENTYNEKDQVKKLIPMTLEGCVVRVSDIIGYIGRDIEDAIRMNVIDIDEIPKEISSVLGLKNSQIIDTLVRDIIRNSIGKDHLTMSDDAFNALKSLKKFNYEHIYSKANSEEMVDFYKEVFNTVFSKYLEDVKNDNKESHIFKIYLNDMSEEYTENTSDERKVIDYIAGMTDDFIVKEYNSIVD